MFLAASKISVTTVLIHKLRTVLKPGDYKSMESMKPDSEDTATMSEIDQDEFCRSKDGTEVVAEHVPVDTDDEAYTTDNREL